MKLNCRSEILCALLLTAPCIDSVLAEPPPHAALRFENTSAFQGRVVFSIDGRNWRPDGFGPGEGTTFIGVLAGSHRFSVTAPDAKAGNASVTLQDKSTSTVFAYIKPVLDPTTRKITQELQLVTLGDPAHQKGKHFYLLYVSSRPAVDVVVNGQTRTLRCLEEIKVDDATSGSIKVEVGGKSVLSFTAEENGNFLGVIFDKPDGSLGGTLLPDYG